MNRDDTKAMTDLPYRAGVGIMLINPEKRIFTGQRIDNEAEAWQMPQGGIDDGEEPRETALRELEEETGIARSLVSILAETPDWLSYELPEDLRGGVWKGRYRGQRQKWYLVDFLGNDKDVNLATPEPEFRAWKWSTAAELPGLIVPFKRKLYADIIDIFSDYLR